ncbi:MAG TPA: preprotein translocase subunit YajC [Oligoflexia bacterium]|nr:preprotein translocase subunit YajC [Oligoflexia bacterium]
MTTLFSLAYADSVPPVPGGANTTTASTQVASGAPGAPGAPSPLASILPLVLMIGVVYFLMIRPQQKKMKEHQSLLEKIQHGDEVVTTGGVFGKVTGVADKVLTLEISDGVRIKLLKNQVASVNPKLS